MEQKIKTSVRNLKVGFYLFWAATLVLFILGEVDVLPVGVMAHSFIQTYYFEVITILVTAIFIPCSLKLFSFVLRRRIDQMQIQQALSQYLVWSSVRLFLLLAVTFTGLVCYFLTLSTTGGLCALMGLTSSFFCVPSDERLRRDLHIHNDEKKEVE